MRDDCRTMLVPIADGRLRKASRTFTRKHTCSSLRTYKPHELRPGSHSEPTNLVSLLYGGEAFSRALYVVGILVRMVNESESAERFLRGRVVSLRPIDDDRLQFLQKDRK